MPDSLLFNGTTDFVNFSPGGISGTGALTMVAIIKKTANSAAWRNIFGWNALDAIFYIDDANPGLLHFGVAGAIFSSFTVSATEGWVLTGFSKPAGSSAGKFHKYVYTTQAWTQTAGGSATTSPVACTVFRVGISGDGFQNFDGNMLIGGMWDSELSDAAIRDLVFRKSAWRAAAPKEAWRLDKTTTISSFVGTSAETSRSGTTVAAGVAPTGWQDYDDAGPVRTRFVYLRKNC